MNSLRRPLRTRSGNMPPTSAAPTKLNRKALERLASRKMRASSSPTGVDDFINDFKAPIHGGGHDNGVISDKENQSMELRDYSRRGETNNMIDNDNELDPADDVIQSIKLRDSKANKSNCSVGETNNENQKRDKQKTFQIQVNGTTHQNNHQTERTKSNNVSKASQPRARGKRNMHHTKKRMVNDEVNESLEFSRLEDEGLMDTIEGMFLSGIEGIEESLASLVPTCDSKQACNAFSHFNL